MIAINGVVVTEVMQKAGENIASNLLDASIENSMGGLGGCRHLDLSNYRSNQDLIKKYIDEDITSVEAIYIAMERAKGKS